VADSVGAKTPLLDCLIDVFAQALPVIGERDGRRHPRNLRAATDNRIRETATR